MPNAREVAEAAVAEADRRLSAALPTLRATAASLARADPGSRSLAHRALGHALLHGGRADEAAGTLRLAVRLAVTSGEPELIAAARTKLAYALHLAGRLGPALREVNRALADGPDDVERTRALGTRALIQRERGEFAPALADLDASVAGLRRLGDELGLQRALINRGILRIDTGAIAAARRDLHEAEELARRWQRPASIGLIASNLGYAASRAGDVPAALVEYDRAERLFRENDLQLSGLLMDRAELLSRVGLDEEAAGDAGRALAAAREERRWLRIPEARLLLARAAAAGGEPAVALDEARRAAQEFRRHGRTTWAAGAALEVALAARELGRPVRWRALAKRADTLATAGWDGPAIEARLLVAAAAPEPDRSAALAVAAAHRSRGPALIRARGWYAEALLADHPAAARRAVRRGLAVLDEHLAGVGADELRVGLARHRVDLAGLGVDLALAGGSPARVFDAVERARATVLVRDTVRLPADPELAALLARFRTSVRERDRAALAEQIRTRSRTARAAGDLLRPVNLAAVDAALGEAAMVLWFARSRRLYALTRVRGRTRLHRLGGDAEVRDDVQRLAFAAHRLADPAPPVRSRDAVATLLSRATGRLSATLLEPLPEIAGRDLVLVPPAVLHAIGWHELPGQDDRAVSVVASVRQWLHAVRAPNGTGRVLVAAGPGLPGARREAVAIASGYGVQPLLESEATVDAVLAGLDGAGLAHLGTHGWLRADNPQFSELTLADGELLVHHLDTIGTLPETMVLASCDSGRAVTRPGEGLLGFAAACLVRGTRTLIAPVAPVPDGATEAVMIDLHARLRAGAAPAAALAAAQAGQPPGRRSFVCFGDGTIQI